MKKKNKSLNRSTKLLAFVYSVFIVFPIYFLLGHAYYLDYINGFAFVGALIGVMLIISVISFIYRKDQFKSFTAIWATVFLCLFLGNEFLLLNYEGQTFIADVYREPEEVIKNSGIHALSIGFNTIYYTNDKTMVEDIYEKDGIQIFDLHEIKNRNRYKGKTSEIKKFFGFEKEPYHVMGENVRSFIQEDIGVINDFLNRENMVGDSAGLALGLSAMVYQGSLHNQIPIGVTGTLEPNGDVHQVGGMKGKMIASAQKGFPYIIVPHANKEEAETVKIQENLAINIVPVQHIDEAVTVINELNKKN